MASAALERVRGSNSKLQGLLQKVGDALAGRTNFGVEDVRAIEQPVAEVAPILSEAVQLRAIVPELDQELKVYGQNLGEMQAALDRIRCVLLARSASVEAQRGHLETVNLWTAAWQRTQPSDQR